MPTRSIKNSPRSKPSSMLSPRERRWKKTTLASVSPNGKGFDLKIQHPSFNEIIWFPDQKSVLNAKQYFDARVFNIHDEKGISDIREDAIRKFDKKIYNIIARYKILHRKENF
jgi:hypothetical protein